MKGILLLSILENKENDKKCVRSSFIFISTYLNVRIEWAPYIMHIHATIVLK